MGGERENRFGDGVQRVPGFDNIVLMKFDQLRCECKEIVQHSPKVISTGNGPASNVL